MSLLCSCAFEKEQTDRGGGDCFTRAALHDSNFGIYIIKRFHLTRTRDKRDTEISEGGGKEHAFIMTYTSERQGRRQDTAQGRGD